MIVGIPHKTVAGRRGAARGICPRIDQQVGNAVDIYVWKNGKLKLMGAVDAADLTGMWYNGSLVYSAKETDGGGFVLNAMAEGEEQEFLLKPISGETDAYRLSDGPNDCVNEYAGKVAKAVYRESEGIEALCLYDTDGSLRAVLRKT